MNLSQDLVKLGVFDIAELRKAVLALGEDDWNLDASRQQAFDAHTQTQTIKLIADGDFRHSNPTTHSIYGRYATLLDPLMSYIRANYLQTMRQRTVAMKYGPGYFIRVILTRLPPGREITPHIDDGQSLRRCHRIHLPILSDEHCIFRVGSTVFHMPEGEMWEINNRRIHAVKNDSDKARIHLIMDYVQPGEVVFDLEGPITA